MKWNAIGSLGFASALALGAASTGVRANMLPSSALHGKKVLFVVGETEKGEPNDDALVKAHLESMGLIVNEVDADEASADSRPDLIVISSTADQYSLVKFRNTPVPIFTWNQPGYPDLAMTGPKLHQDFEVVDPQTYFARSFSVLYGYAANTTNEIARAVDLKPQLFGTFYLKPETVGWGRPTNAATVISNFEGDPYKAGIFTYEKGARMYDDVSAPGRRVGFYMTNGNFHSLTAVYGPAANDPSMKDWYKSLDLFDASIRWAISPPAPAPKNDPAALFARLSAAAAGKKALFVGRKFTPEGAEADQHIIERLEKVGFKVTFRDQTDSDAGADQFDLIVLSATNSKYKLTNKYRDVARPVLCLEALMSDMLRLAGRDRYVDYGEHGEPGESEDPPVDSLMIVNPDNQMSAGLSGVVKIINDKDVLKWATPSPGATVIATLPDRPEQAAIFGYKKGATMDGYFQAPARRAVFPLDNPAFDDLTPSGLALFDATVLWMIQP